MDGPVLLGIAEWSVVAIVATRIVADLSGVEEIKAVSVLGLALVPFFAAVAAGIGGWARDIAEARGTAVTTSTGARLLAWPYATPGRVRAGAAILAVVTLVWATDGLDVLL